MTTEHDMAVAMATEIGKQVPVKQVYEDAGSPAVRQLGATLEDVVKCIRLVGFPIQWLAVQQDRYRAFIERAAQTVPEERRVLPAPQILGPILEGIRYELDDTPIVDMFANLLGSAMDTEKLDGVFPHFSSIIRQLSPDEAIILQYMKENNLQAIHYTPGIFQINPDPDNFYVVEAIGLSAPDYSKIYMDHLFNLGLIAWAGELQDAIEYEGRQVSSMYLRLSPMGEQFMSVCSPTPPPGTP